MPEKLRVEYAQLWLSMTPPQDHKKIEEIFRNWGIGSINLFQAIIKQNGIRTKMNKENEQEIGSNSKETDSVPEIIQVDSFDLTKEKKEKIYSDLYKKVNEKGVTKSGSYIKDKLKQLLQDTSKFPQELIFIGRTMTYIGIDSL
jgi:hypothetical protein